MGKVKGRFIIKETLFWLVLSTFMYFTITEYGEKPFKEGFLEMTKNPISYYIVLGSIVVSVILVYFVKKHKNGE